ncbi:resolvase family protein [Xenococcus sp. PCC 7305]|uniref:recombinase family protein n=1 Tax=Xenococcus sp. PCC 7305 TaxID=102125 RepID=UPI0002ABD32A|nr:recombinase family protein [Xenococcus sp. PCC 7305]ELS02662.1 resolvase family protein [Xenococcus sp. PCC 7305]
MKVVAYLYIDPLLETPPDKNIWGQEIDDIYLDLAGRQQLLKLIDDSQKNPPQKIFIRRLEDLGNNIVDIGDRLKKLESLGIEVIAIEQDYQSSKFSQKSNQDTKLALIQLLEKVTSNKRKERLIQGHARNRLKVLPPPGKAPYGYRRGQDKYIIDKSTAPVVKDFFEQFLLFGSLRGAVRYLAKRYGKKVAPSTGKNWLTNPVYRGDLKYKDNQVILNTHAAILDREEAAQIDRILRRNSRLPSRTASAPRSLAGLITCQECHLPMVISRVTQRKNKQEYLYLRCHDCPRETKCKAIHYQEILQQAITQICDELPIAVEQVNLQNITIFKEQIQSTIKQKKEILLQLPILQRQNILDQETAKLRNYKLQTEISQLETQLAQLPPENLKAIAKTVSIPQFWLDLSEPERRFYFREFIKQIEIVRLDGNKWNLNLVFIF